ncbi:MAG TPA: hypothetical protein VJ643_05185 [Nitrososphaera sp.]|nr:hypothetical protein [Nitrososphaera sp.]
MEVGPGGRQIQVEYPDGNPIELFESARGYLIMLHFIFLLFNDIQR